MPKISILIPVYNVEKYLARCLDSVIAQTFKDFEVICINDGSTDGCDKILNNYAAKDGRIKVFTQKNQGLSVARNNALKIARGEYIAFLDSDDAMHPQLLEITYDMAVKHFAELVNFQYEASDGIKYLPSTINTAKLKIKKTLSPLFMGNKKSNYKISLNVWTKLYKKELLSELEFIPKIHFEDFPYTYAVLARKPLTVSLSVPLIFYTINENSISNKKANPQQIKDYHTGIKFVYEIYKQPNLKKELKFLLKDFMPTILKQQLGRCQRAPKEVQQKMFEAFSDELRDLQQKGLLSWRGHKLSRYLKYRKLIKGYAR